ncbi:MAG: hypothetical protein NT049_03440, partial [Planctomycetota bacterium]|nr:hypothetical protein [Planctomycetota bacterium]
MQRSIRGLIAGCLALLLAGAVLAGEAGKAAPSPQAAQPALAARLLLPPPFSDRLGLSEEQRAGVAKAADEFVAKFPELGSLPADLMKLRADMQQARQQEDRTKYRSLQLQVSALANKLIGLRANFEPALLAALTDEQKKKQAEQRAEWLHPASVMSLLQGGQGGGGAQSSPAGPARQVDLAALKPLTEMGAAEYNGFKGGLYPDGKNERPAAHEAAGLALARTVQPLGADGKPDAAAGKIVLLSVGMSNTMQATNGFKEVADNDPEKNPQVLIVNGSQGGMTAFRTQDPDDKGSGTQFWTTVDNRLREAGATNAQVQAVWLKQADAGPSEGFPEYARKLVAEQARIMQVLHQRFPNLKLVYLSSRTYGGYAKSRLNPEPYALESGFSVKWLVEKQIKGDADLNFDPAKGAVKAPWMSWGPYLWAAGATKRADGFSWEQGDSTEGDGTHESPAGMKKVGEALL